MQVVFSDPKLAALCSQASLAQRALGATGAKKLRVRLAELQAAANVSALPGGHPHALTKERTGQFSVRLDGGRRLVFEPANEPVPKRDGSIVWSEVTAVRVVFIGDYHD